MKNLYSKIKKTLVKTIIVAFIYLHLFMLNTSECISFNVYINIQIVIYLDYYSNHIYNILSFLSIDSKFYCEL